MKSPWRTVLVSLAVVLVALLSGLVLRGMIMDDFQRYIEGERPALARTGLLVLVWPLFLSVPALALGFFLARKSTGPVEKPHPVARRDPGADLNTGLAFPEKDKAADIQDKPVRELGKKIPSQREPESSEVIAAKKDEPVVVTDDSPEADDADDEDMQPLASDPDRITRIVAGLNKLAKARTLGRAPQKQPVELAPFLTAIIERARGSFPDKDIAFSLECRSGLALSADPDCLTGILENLVENAAKAVKNAGTVTVSAEAKGDHTLFTVRDTGTGIRRKDIPHLYEQYYRASGSGIGLGLTIVKELVDACGGTIDVQTARGKGSTFTVSLPSS